MLTPCYPAPAAASSFNDDVRLFYATRPFELDRSRNAGCESSGNAHTAQLRQERLGSARVGGDPLVVYQDYTDNRSALRHLHRVVARHDRSDLDFCRIDGVCNGRGVVEDPPAPSADSRSGNHEIKLVVSNHSNAHRR